MTKAHRPAKSPKPAPLRLHRAVFAGSFDPATFGHLDVIARGRELFDELVVAVGRNPNKETLFSSDERVEIITELVAEMCRKHPAAATVRVEAFDGLTVDFARSVGASALLRGIRNLSDLQNEVQQAVTNREIANLETAFVVAGQTFAYTSSSLIKQLTAMGKDLKPLKNMVPARVIAGLRIKKQQNHPLLVRLMANKDEVGGD